VLAAELQRADVHWIPGGLRRDKVSCGAVCGVAGCLGDGEEAGEDCDAGIG
jgi:hypothetical protein